MNPQPNNPGPARRGKLVLMDGSLAPEGQQLKELVERAKDRGWVRDVPIWAQKASARLANKRQVLGY